MPTHKGVEVWIEDSKSRKLNHQKMTINLVDDRMVTAEAMMWRGELYTVHCLSPISAFCDVFIINACRKRAARFYLDKSLATSNNASGSSADHTEGRYRDHGLRTPKGKCKHGTLGGVEVEIRRIGEFIEVEPRDECDPSGDQGAAITFSMLDDFNQPPWLVFHFDISAKKPPAVLAPAVEPVWRHVPYRVIRNQSRSTSSSFSSTEGESLAMMTTAGVGGDLRGVSLDQLCEEYRREEAEEQRLLQKLQEQLQIKKTRNMELRRLLGETF